ncbi:MAG TPA: nuclear transport factor 2 family protein [Polyangiaceae bacterium]|nr:nuclear transport factor 2 family protein [Polyangiaceae bacterium]
MAQQAVETELLELEKSYWQALKDHDFDAALALTDDPCIVAGAQGVSSIGKDQFRKMMEDEHYSLDNFRIGDEVQVRMLSDDVAILAYKVHEELTLDGKPVTVEAADASTWVRRDGHWLCTLHSESILGDPFGRSAPKPIEAD